ncbi:pseudouridine synthase family protein [Williamwhitmania taraxaci]|uniref:Methyltransferase domain-containing protein n=1 Tax=Williamwhitmania taraxaci TaxID=1640674 RepID=A0A1G6T0B3_9BACT|nr:hypothetical protein [Williamwhitmania taraxaci]SDD22582.1 hypothetical protein SAMN05216323_11088 [Williamwhitmania taraxaci]
MIKQIYRFLSPRFQNLFLEYKVAFKPRYGHGSQPHRRLYEIIDAGRLGYAEILNEALLYKDSFQSIRIDSDPNPINPIYNNGYLPGLDIVALYTIIAKFKPETYFEVGSGNSTKVANKAIKELGLDTKIVSVDPNPRAEIDALAHKVIRKPFENIDFSEIFSLNLKSAGRLLGFKS